jgi:hypothetical protein
MTRRRVQCAMCGQFLELEEPRVIASEHLNHDCYGSGHRRGTFHMRCWQQIEQAVRGIKG